MTEGQKISTKQTRTAKKHRPGSPEDKAPVFIGPEVLLIFVRQEKERMIFKTKTGTLLFFDSVLFDINNYKQHETK